MFFGSLTLSVILTTVGFQTASAIVMGFTDSHRLKFVTCGEVTKTLHWVMRDVYLEPGCTLLTTTHGIFQVDAKDIIHTGLSEGRSFEWHEMCENLYYKHFDSLSEDHPGWVYHKPPVSENESQEIQVVRNEPIPLPKGWVKITCAPITNKVDPWQSTYPQATVRGEKVFFYSGVGDRLRVFNQDPKVAPRWDNELEADIKPLRISNSYFYGDKEQGLSISDIYQSPFPDDPSLNTRPANLYVHSGEFGIRHKGDVSEISGLGMESISTDEYLKVEFVNPYEEIDTPQYEVINTAQYEVIDKKPSCWEKLTRCLKKQNEGQE